MHFPQIRRHALIVVFVSLLAMSFAMVLVQPRARRLPTAVVVSTSPITAGTAAQGTATGSKQEGALDCTRVYTSLGEALRNPAQVCNLNLDFQQLAELPPQIAQFSNLMELHAANNSLASLPPEIGALPHLVTLDLSGNELTKLPSSIGNLSKLTSLHLERNFLGNLPPEIGELQHLTVLTLSGNLLTSLPAEIDNLTKLEDLTVQDNRLAGLPPELLGLANLRYLHLGGNPLCLSDWEANASASSTIQALSPHLTGSPCFRWTNEE